MINKIRHYFKRRQALKLFADRFLFEPVAPIAPAIAPNTIIQNPVPPQTVPMPSNTPPVMPEPINQPMQIPVQEASTKEQIVQTLQPLAQSNQAKMDVINRRLQ
jgi:hypothetical protein